MNKKQHEKMISMIEEMKARALQGSKDNGLKGKVAELETALYCNVYRDKVQGNDKIDLVQYSSDRKHRYSIEIKSGGGELAVLDDNGQIVKDFTSNDYIAYAPVLDLDLDATEQLRVFTTDQFLELAKSMKLIRTKRSSKGTKQDRITMQSWNKKDLTTGRNLKMLELWEKGIPFRDFYTELKGA